MGVERWMCKNEENTRGFSWLTSWTLSSEVCNDLVKQGDLIGADHWSLRTTALGSPLLCPCKRSVRNGSTYHQGMGISSPMCTRLGNTPYMPSSPSPRCTSLSIIMCVCVWAEMWNWGGFFQQLKAGSVCVLDRARSTWAILQSSPHYSAYVKAGLQINNRACCHCTGAVMLKGCMNIVGHATPSWTIFLSHTQTLPRISPPTGPTNTSLFSDVLCHDLQLSWKAYKLQWVGWRTG